MSVERYDPLGGGELIRIEAVSVPRPKVLRVDFSDGVSRDVDFSGLIASSKWFKTLAFDEAFADVKIIHHQRALQWANGVDFCADALRMRADDQAIAQERETA